jgi:hypothetical protein
VVERRGSFQSFITSKSTNATSYKNEDPSTQGIVPPTNTFDSRTNNNNNNNKHSGTTKYTRGFRHDYASANDNASDNASDCKSISSNASDTVSDFHSTSNITSDNASNWALVSAYASDFASAFICASDWHLATDAASDFASDVASVFEGATGAWEAVSTDYNLNKYYNNNNHNNNININSACGEGWTDSGTGAGSAY